MILKSGRQRMRFLIWALVGILTLFSFQLLYFNQQILDDLEKIDRQNLQASFFDAALIESKKEKEIVLLFVGDIMLDRGVRHYIKRYQDFRYPFLKIAAELRSADITFGNLEGPISDRGRNQGSIYSFRFDPGVIEGLAFAGFDVLSLANNHIWDWGREALEDTISLLAAEDIETIGAGRNYSEANSPAIFTINDTQIAFFAYTTFYPKSLWAKNNLPGISWFDLEKVKQDIEKIRAEVDIIIVSMHWGDEYKERSNIQQQRIARSLVQAGTDLVIGHHPHVVQEIEKYKQAWVAYFLGNFVFDQGFSKETMQGLMLEVKIQNQEIIAVKPIKIKLTETFQPQIFNQHF